jgi:hypothetical protein
MVTSINWTDKAIADITLKVRIQVLKRERGLQEKRKLGNVTVR